MVINDDDIYVQASNFVYDTLHLDSVPEDQHADRVLKLLQTISDVEIVTHCQKTDPKLQRSKRYPILMSVKRAVNRIREEQRAIRDADSDLEAVDPETLMDVKDQNQLNKSVVGLWKQTGDNQDSPESTPVAEDLAEKPKKRKDAKDSKEPKKKPKNTADKYKPASAITLADLGGIEPVIQQVLEMIAMPLCHPEIYAHLGSDIPRGVLLHGPPGCGKTMLANAIANYVGVPFVSVSAPSVVSGMSGESEKKLRDIFDDARDIAPCLMFIDEIDAITPKRESAQREMERRIVAQLLTCMDSLSLEQTGGRPVIIIGATNRPDAIDPALRRGGRFDAEISMNVPDQEAREKILRTITAKLTLEGGFDYVRLARATPGYVGADLKALVTAAGAHAMKRIFASSDDDLSNGVSEMDIDHDQKPVHPIQRFLQNHPDELTPQELAPLAITANDFLAALPTVQPSSKREGFATVPDVTWDDVGAMSAVREELEYAIVRPIQTPELFRAMGIVAPSGVLLWGPPGCGKTLLAKAVANESQANFISIRGPELLNKYVGESERAVRQVFVRARASVPCVIFFDELDALVPRRDDTGSEASSRVVNTLLTELDGVADRQGVYVVGATNRRDMIDPAMLRPGRLDKQLFVDLPSAEERFEILGKLARKKPLDPAIDLTAIAHDERCRNFSGADLYMLVTQAAVLALKRGYTSGATVVTQADFDAAFDAVIPSVKDSDRLKYRRMNDRDRL